MPAPSPPRMPMRVAIRGEVYEDHQQGLACPCMPLLVPVYGTGELGRRLLGTSLYHRSTVYAVRVGAARDV